MSYLRTIDELMAPHWERVLASDVVRTMSSDTPDRAAYVAFLQNLWHHVRHTPRKLALAAWRCGPDQRGLRDHLSGHAREETGHDEWILDDLEALGIGREETVSAAPTPAMRALVAHGYYLAGTEHPATILAEAYFVERLSQGQATGVAERLRESLGIPKAATTFLDSHGELDQDHAAEYAHVFSELLDDEGRAAVLAVAPAAGWTYASAYEAIELSPARASLREAA